MWWHTALVLLISLAVIWSLIVIGLWRNAPAGYALKNSLRFLPDVLRLLHRLAKDRALPRSSRLLLWVLMLYLALPFDVIPDFVPVIGYADDVIVIVLTLRSVVKGAGATAIARHWPGTPEGLEVLRLLIA